MENKINRYVNKTFLIVDDFMEFKHSLKNMIETLGATKIDLAANATQSIELYSKTYHDIILLDYNLGDGLNGLQMLEELSQRDILRHETIVILITGETSMEMVQGVIDVRPNDYLPKPFTKAILKKRLDKAYERNQAIKPVLLALNKKDYLRVIDHCDQLISQGSKYSMACQRIKADSCLRMGKPNIAMTIYESILEKRKINWALLGRARCKVHSSQYADAIADFNQIIASQHYAIEAYDSKAESQLALGDHESSYRTIQKAVSISPNSVPRQRLLAKLATKYQHYETALSARRKIISLSRFLSNKYPDDYLRLARLLSLIHAGNYGAPTRRAPAELSRLLKEMQVIFQNDVQLSIAILIHQGIYHFMTQQRSEAKTKIQQAVRRLNELPEKIKPYLNDEIAFAYKICKDQPLTKDLYQRFYEISNENANVSRSGNYNKQGMSKFKAKDYHGAYDSFKMAYRNDTSNINITLNLMQVMLKLIIQSGCKNEFRELLEMCAQTFKLLTSNDQRVSHFKTLYNSIRTHLINENTSKRSEHG